MAATERVVVLLTPEQKKQIAARARAENLSLSDYMRRRAIGEDELLDELLGALRVSTAGALETLDGVIPRLERADAGRAERDTQAYQRALDEFGDLELAAFAELVTPQSEAANGSNAEAAGSP